MNPKYVITLEQAKKLKELGVRQESEFYWKYLRSVDKNKEKWRLMAKTETDEFNWYILERCSAFHVGELGEMLPLSLWHNNDWRYLRQNKTKDNEKWECSYNTFFSCFGNTEAQARAEMLIYLLEHKLIK
jgi:hypothetical protein